MVGLEGNVRLGIVGAAPEHLARIQEWTAAFRKIDATVEAVSAITPARHDLYLVMLEPATKLESVLIDAASTPCLALATGEDESLAEAALAAGAVDFLLWDSLDAARLERGLRFALRRARALDTLMARERVLAMARERDQLRLANALHDGPLQDSIGARFLLGALTAGDSVEEIQSSLQLVIQALRTLCSDLKPPALAPFGLEKAIRAHMQGIQTRYPDLEFTLELDVDSLQLMEWARLALFRIFQAAMANVCRHAQATHVWVRLRLEDEQIRLTVADDGQGFEVPTSWLDFARTERYGLLTMQERVDALQGQLMVQSTIGSGARVMIQAPLRQPPVPLPRFLASSAPDKTAPDRNG